jgi:hypothetical protein
MRGRGLGGGGVRGNLKEVRRATISVDVSNLLHFDVNHLFMAIIFNVDANILWTPKSISTLIFRGCNKKGTNFLKKFPSA